jgi:uncharacterized protein YndB with AHSA1/START domain
MNDRIERSTAIDAPLERVWELVTEPGWWVPTTSPQPADRTTGAVTVRESEKWGRFPVRVERLDPMSYAAFRWASQFPGEDLTDGKTTLVEFHLTPADTGVTVTVVETGFAAIDASDEVRQAGISANSSGWEQELASLTERAERVHSV